MAVSFMLLFASLRKGVYPILRKRKAENRNPDTRILIFGIISTFRIPATRCYGYLLFPQY